MSKGISETAFSTQVEELLRRFGWRFMHIKPSVMQSGHWASSMNPEGKGWLDYCAVRPPRLLFAELKDAKTTLTPEQDEWFDDLIECTRQIMINPVPVPVGRKIELFPSFEVYLWRPSMIEKIVEILR